MADENHDAREGEFVQAVERVFRVIRAFGREHPRLSLSEVARLSDLTRATARRFLLTLEALGYVGSDAEGFYLRPKLLDLGFAYLSSVPVWDLVQSHMERMVKEAKESSSCSVLDGGEILYVVRVPTAGFLRIEIELGTRIPAHLTSMGRVLLANLTKEQLDRYFVSTKLEKLTPSTIASERELRKVLSKVREQGWAVVDQELELGLRSVSVPLRDTTGRVFAAMNMATHALRVSDDRLMNELLPLLQRTGASIEEDISVRRSDIPV